MGRLSYASQVYEFEDRTLHHLKVVIGMRLLQRECFFFTFTENRAKTLTTIWIAPAIPITFEFDGTAPATLNKKWILELIRSSYRPYGLTLIPEDEDNLHES